MANSITLPAPAGGLNFRDSEYGLSLSNARILHNLMWTSGKMGPRKSFESARSTSSYTTPGNFMALIPLYVDSGGGAIFHQVGTDTKVMSGPNGDASLSGPTLHTWGSTVTANYISRVFDQKTFVCAPPNAPIEMDEPGTTVGNASFSGGITAANIVGCHPFKSRMYWWEAQADSFWYTAVNAGAGAVSEFSLKAATNNGGNILMITSLTRDGGAGPDDYLAIFVSSGEVLVYQGSNPGDADDWSLVGRYIVPVPLSTLGFAQVGADVVYLSHRGLVSLRDVMASGGESIGSGPMQAINNRLKEFMFLESSTVAPNSRQDNVFFSKTHGLLFVTMFHVHDRQGDNSSVTYVLDVDAGNQGRWMTWGINKDTIDLYGDRRDEVPTFETGNNYSTDFDFLSWGEDDFIGVPQLYGLCARKADDDPTGDDYVVEYPSRTFSSQSDLDLYEIQCLIRWGWQAHDELRNFRVSEFRINLEHKTPITLDVQNIYVATDTDYDTWELMWTKTTQTGTDHQAEWEGASAEGLNFQLTYQFSAEYTTSGYNFPTFNNFNLFGIDVLLTRTGDSL